MTATLLERDGELGTLAAAGAAAGAGHGSVVVVEGPAGIGKTALLAAQTADDRSLVLRARGAVFEREFAYGIARQLFGRLLSDAQGDELLRGPASLAAPALGLAQSTAPPADPFAPVYGLYWLTTNLAERQPLTLVVDDLHWADEPSLRFLAYLGRRCADLPVLIVLATRPPDETAAEILANLVADPAVRTLEMRPLSTAAASRLAADAFGRAAEDEFVAACHAVSAGNPFLLGQLLTRLAREGAEPVAAAAPRIHDIGSLGVSRTILAQLGPLDAATVAFARALAVLGDDAELHAVLGLAGLEDADGGRAARTLTRMGVLLGELPLRFVHALVRTAVYVDIPAVERALMHARAARLLADRGADDDHVAAHLLASEPAGEAWVVERLRSVAADAASRGAPDVAATYLARALAEPPPADRRASVLRELGRVEAPVRGLPHLHEALAAAGTEAERLEIAVELVEGHWRIADFDGAHDVAQKMFEAATDPDGARRLERLAVTSALTAAQHKVAPALARLEEIAAKDRDADPALRAFVGLMRVSAEDPDPAGADLIAAALRERPASASSIHWAITTLFPTAWMDRLEEAEQGWTAILRDAQAKALPIAAFIAFTFRSDVAYRRGDLRDAEADARAALELADEHGFPSRISTHGHLINVLIDRGRLDEALDLHAPDGVEIPVPPHVYPATYMLETTARLHLARGAPARALEQSLECGRRLRAWQRHSPACCAWRSTAALAHLQLGDPDAARSLAAEDLRLSRQLRLARAEGIALRTLGLIEGGDAGIEHLRASVDALHRSAGRLEPARSMVELGAALRRAGSRAEARERLTEGLEGAARTGATALAERAREELRAAGARPRRDMVTGRDALTPSELRVARLAAEGLTNREVAQSLFITPRTVDNHLTRAYQKLGINSRTQLQAALAAEPG